MERYIGHKNGYVILLFSVCIGLTCLYYYIILDKRFSLPSGVPTHKAHHALEFTRELLRDAIPRKGSFEKKLESSMSQEPGEVGDKKNGMRWNRGGTARASSQQMQSVVDEENETVISPFQPQRDSRATRERYTRAMCSVLNPEAELMESPFMMQRGEFDVHSLS